MTALSQSSSARDRAVRSARRLRLMGRLSTMLLKRRLTLSRKPEITSAMNSQESDAKAAKFHEQNPHVYEQLLSLCMELRKKGYPQYSVRGLFEVLRFKFSVQTSSEDEFKLNNNMTPWYARKIMEENRSLDGFFVTRIRR